jgi:hypothetical protein
MHIVIDSCSGDTREKNWGTRSFSYININLFPTITCMLSLSGPQSAPSFISFILRLLQASGVRSREFSSLLCHGNRYCWSRETLHCTRNGSNKHERTDCIDRCLRRGSLGTSSLIYTEGQTILVSGQNKANPPNPNQILRPVL